MMSTSIAKLIHPSMVKPRHAVRHDQAGAVFDEHMALIAYSEAKHGDSSVKTMSTLCRIGRDGWS
jgi:hypothetical protein